MATKTNEIEASKTKQNGIKADTTKSNEVVTESTVRIPLAVVFARLDDVLDGTPQGAKVEKDSVLAVSVEKREAVK